MTALVQYEPWSVVPRLQEEINRLFGSVLQDGSVLPDEKEASTATWSPPVDIHEYADRFALTVDLPGVEPSSVELTLENGVLTLSGERRDTATGRPGEIAEVRRAERGQGRFHRRFVLPDTVDSERVHATGANGVLTISIPKQAHAVPRRIPITA
jgi:HSP20 family protein